MDVDADVIDCAMIYLFLPGDHPVRLVKILTGTVFFLPVIILYHISREMSIGKTTIFRTIFIVNFVHFASAIFHTYFCS
nr:MAG TPA_asm: hypothetical protein [Caudoviricetes sp.]